MNATKIDRPADPASKVKTRLLACLGFLRHLWLRFLGFEAPDFKDERAVKVVAEPEDYQIRLADMIAKQIEVEQGLAGTRMMWNLTFQGFMVAGYALVASSSGSNPSRLILETLISLTSVVIAYATLRGVVASQIQRQYLKDCWAANDLRRFFPEPFSVTRTSLWGRFPAYIICIALITMWLTLLAVQWCSEGDADKSVKVEVEGKPEVVLPVSGLQAKDRDVAAATQDVTLAPGASLRVTPQSPTAAQSSTPSGP